MAGANYKRDKDTDLDSSETEEEFLGLMAKDLTDEEEETDDRYIARSKNGRSSTHVEEKATTASQASLTLSNSHTPGKRKSPDLVATPNAVKRSKKQRNTSQAFKLQCIDIQEIKACLDTKGCTCGEKCFKKLQQHQNRAVRAIENLRLQRFAG